MIPTTVLPLRCTSLASAVTVMGPSSWIVCRQMTCGPVMLYSADSRRE